MSSLTPVAFAADCEPVVGRFASVEGSVEVRRGEVAAWSRASVDDALCRDDTVRAGRSARAAIVLVNEAVLRVDAGTTLRLLSVPGVEDEPSVLDLLRGAIKSFSRKPRLIKVNSPYLNGTIEGTEFQIRVSADDAVLTVLEGVVLAANAAGEVRVGAGQAARAGAGQAPQLRTLVRPRDAVQWALYYPPVLSAGAGALPREVERAQAYAAAGDPDAAFDELERVAAGDRDTTWHVHRAALALSVGRVDTARSDIARAIEQAPSDGRALALRAVINVAQNRVEDALADGRRAVEVDPSPAAHIALSYARQAAFRIAAARDGLIAAVTAYPDDALAWARLGELQLMLGEREAAVASAATAQRLAPDLPRADLVLGYAALAGFERQQARAAFERVIRRRSADPLGHLGLGLVEIAEGDLVSGRQRIEVAVGLDSGSALLRSYLGKAYFEEERTPLDLEQFAIARTLDPNDPTPFLYSAIAKQTTNRPVEALHDLQESIERNDNRAVYRGRLLLDEDRAARGTSLARVHDDLGFDQLGLNASADSLTTDPTNASAHRFRSDSYRAQPRREISRVSELLQSQMFQDVNMNPIQPSVASTGLNIVSSGGPTTTGFNEFTPLFEQNRGRLDATGFAGSNGTIGGETALSGVFDNVSLSAGGFAFNTDGFRENNYLRHRIADAYAQVALTPAINLQAEFRDRDTRHGDIFMNFDPADFDPTLHNENEEQTARVGLRVTPSERSTFLFSTIFSDRSFTASRQTRIEPQGTVLGGRIDERENGGDESQQYEGLYAFRSERFNAIAGGAYSRVDIAETLTIASSTDVDPPATVAGRNCLQLVPVPTPIFVPGAGAVCPVGTIDLGPVIVDPPPLTANTTTLIPLNSIADDYRGYVYVNGEVIPSLTATVGLSYTDFEDAFGAFDRWNPKLGLQWDVTDALRLRGAFFKVVKPVLASNRLLEPTQVAGFNQFFDDGNATRSTRYGLGLDFRAAPGLYVGGELTHRDIGFRRIDLTGNAATVEDQDEYTHSAYAYWTPAERWALSARAVYDSFENSVPNLSTPDRVITRSFPLRAFYFHPNGLFMEAGGTWVRQDVRRPANSSLAQGDSSFAVFDIGAGYRLPKRMGVISVSVHNLFDREMKYQDDSYRNFDQEPSGTPFVPERTIMGRFSLSLQ